MSEKPTPKSIPSSFMNAALAVLVGSIALYLAIQLLEYIAVPLAVLGCLAIAALAFVWRRRSRGPSDGW